MNSRAPIAQAAVLLPEESSRKITFAGLYRTAYGNLADGQDRICSI